MTSATTRNSLTWVICRKSKASLSFYTLANVIQLTLHGNSDPSLLKIPCLVLKVNLTYKMYISGIERNFQRSRRIRPSKTLSKPKIQISIVIAHKSYGLHKSYVHYFTPLKILEPNLIRHHSSNSSMPEHKLIPEKLLSTLP